MGRSFEAVFEAEFASLHRYLARRVGAAAADELAAETFAVACRNWDRLDPARPVRPWLYGIAANLMRHHWRKERRMLRAYARSGVDPVFAEEDAAAERADADSRVGNSTNPWEGGTPPGSSAVDRDWTPLIPSRTRRG